MLTIPEKLYLLPPKPVQGFTYWLRQNSLSHTQHDSHKSPGLCQQLVLVLGGLQSSLTSCICSLSIPPWYHGTSCTTNCSHYSLLHWQ